VLLSATVFLGGSPVSSRARSSASPSSPRMSASFIAPRTLWRSVPISISASTNPALTSLALSVFCLFRAHRRELVWTKCQCFSSKRSAKWRTLSNSLAISVRSRSIVASLRSPSFHKALHNARARTAALFLVSRAKTSFARESWRLAEIVHFVCYFWRPAASG